MSDLFKKIVGISHKWYHILEFLDGELNDVENNVMGQLKKLNNKMIATLYTMILWLH